SAYEPARRVVRTVPGRVIYAGDDRILTRLIGVTASRSAYITLASAAKHGGHHIFREDAVRRLRDKRLHHQPARMACRAIHQIDCRLPVLDAGVFVTASEVEAQTGKR